MLPASPRPNLRRSRAHGPCSRDAGFTLTEVMVVLVIIGVMASISMPLLFQDSKVAGVRTFASEIARDLQRARIEAVSERLPIRAFFFSDRVELRSATPGATPGAAPNTPTLATPIRRMLTAKEGITILDVTTAPAPPPAAQVLDTATPKVIEFAGIGAAQFVGLPAMTPIYVWVQHAALTAQSGHRLLRVDVTPLTGFVHLQEQP